jgi:putative transposase
VAVDGANRNDMKMTEPTLDSMVIKRPDLTPTKPQHLCLDKDFDFDEVRKLVETHDYIPHIQSRGEEAQAKLKVPKYRGPPLGRGTHSFLDEPLPPHSDPLGEES